jgi:hypothetical protein
MLFPSLVEERFQAAPANQVMRIPSTMNAVHQPLATHPAGKLQQCHRGNDQLANEVRQQCRGRALYFAGESM